MGQKAPGVQVYADAGLEKKISCDLPTDAVIRVKKVTKDELFTTVFWNGLVILMPQNVIDNFRTCNSNQQLVSKDLNRETLIELVTSFRDIEFNGTYSEKSMELENTCDQLNSLTIIYNQDSCAFTPSAMDYKKKIESEVIKMEKSIAEVETLYKACSKLSAFEQKVIEDEINHHDTLMSMIMLVYTPIEPETFVDEYPEEINELLLFTNWILGSANLVDSWSYSVEFELIDDKGDVRYSKACPKNKTYWMAALSNKLSEFRPLSLLTDPKGIDN